MTEALLTPNKWSRPQRKLSEVKAIVLHWYMHPGESARGAREWWEMRKSGTSGFGSAHVAIDDRETLLCVPYDEMAYHVGANTYTQFALEQLSPYPNNCTIGVELAHADWAGKPSLDVWERALSVCIELCRRYRLPPTMIVTHFDVTGHQAKWGQYQCHQWFATQPGELARFRAQVRGGFAA